MPYNTIAVVIEPIANNTAAATHQVAPYDVLDPMSLPLERLLRPSERHVVRASSASPRSGQPHHGFPEGTELLAIVVLNRPDVRNALNHAMVDELHDAVAQLRDIDNLRGIIFVGAGGKAFLGGADIGELAQRNRLDALRRINARLFQEIESLPVPTIAAVSGYALGGGCEMALACDLRVCGKSAKLGQPEVGLGILPGAGATYRLPRVVGTAVARELIFTGRIINASEALRIGLVNHVVDDEQVVHRACELVREIAANSGLAVRLAKVALNAASGCATDMAVESAAQAILFEDADKQARMGKFIAERDARRHQRTKPA